LSDSKLVRNVRDKSDGNVIRMPSSF
jgi:hypothetical protein